MPRRTDIDSVLVIGSGPIVIGQACEFDYSGTQACRVLREEGLRVVLVNSNPATIMTDPEFADATYVEPITPEVVEAIIAKERPDALLPTLGGQTALNTAIALHEAGVLEQYDVELIGANIAAIEKGEDREQFKDVVARVAERRRGRRRRQRDLPLDGRTASRRPSDLGYPVVVRPVVHDGRARLRHRVRRGRPAPHRRRRACTTRRPPRCSWRSRSSAGRSTSSSSCATRNDNVVVVCSIENVDPMGVHTGDSITVAPALTLTDREYQRLRDIGIAVIREVGVDTGGCNIQFAVNPVDGRVVVIEMNPRVSPLVGAGVEGDRLPDREDRRPARGRLHARRDPERHHRGRRRRSFEPTLDYVVVKVPRFAFEKFPAADPTLTTTMKSVGEAMAIGRNFTEALQKALRSLEKTGAQFHWDGDAPSGEALDALLATIAAADRGPAASTSSRRCAAGADRVRAGCTSRPAIDPWFLDQLLLIDEVAAEVRDGGRAHPGRCCATPSGTASPTRRSARLRGDARGRRPRRPARARRPPGLQDRRHLRRRVRRAARRTTTRRYDEENEVAPRDRREGHHPRLRARTGSGRASSSTTRACTPRSRCARPGTRPSWSTATRRRSRPTTTPPTGCTSSR